MRIAAIAVGALIAMHPINGFTADSVPIKTSEFLSYCKSQDHTTDCQNKITNIYVAMMINKTFNSFCPPRGMKAKESAEKVLVWLSTHPEALQQPTSKGVSTAYLAMYPCQK